MALNFEIEGSPAYPNDILDFALSIGENGQITIPEKLVFSGSSAAIILKEVNKGNVFKKLSLDVWNDGTQIFRGFINLQDDLIIHGDRDVEVNIISYDSFDWIEEFGNGVSFGVLQLNGHITVSDYREIEYIQNFKPDAAVAFTASLGIYSTVKGLIDAVRELSDIIIEGLPEDPLGYLKGLLRIVIKVIYIILLVLALVVLLEQFIKAIFPQKGTFKVLTVKKMFESICSYFDLKFKSSIFDGQGANMIYIPYKDGETDKGIPSPNSSLYNCGDFLNAMKQVFNADIKIRNGVMRFERWDNFVLRNSTVLKNNFSDQERLLNTYSFNTDEAIGNYNIFYTTDASELNTLDGSTLAFQQSIDGIKGLTQIALPFAQAKNKTTRSNIEEDLTVIEGIVNGIISLFGSGSNNNNKNSKNGALLVSGETFTVDKIAFIRGKSIDTIPAIYWWNNFHYVNSYLVNQWINYNATPMEMSFQEFKQLIDNNTLIDDNGREVQVTEATYNPSLASANVTYRERKIYAKGLKERIIT